jgi:hypothetical protein
MLVLTQLVCGHPYAVHIFAKLMSVLFWDVTPDIPVGVYRYLEGKYFLHFQGRRVMQARNLAACFLLIVFLA